MNILYDYMIKDLFEPIMRCINGYKIYKYNCNSFNLKTYLDKGKNNVISIRVYNFIIRIFVEKKDVIIGRYNNNTNSRISWDRQYYYKNAKLKDFMDVYSHMNTHN